MLAAKLRLILDETANMYSRLEDTDDFDVAAEVGGDIDGAFALGICEGEIYFAKNLLRILDVLEEQERDNG